MPVAVSSTLMPSSETSVPAPISTTKWVAEAARVLEPRQTVLTTTPMIEDSGFAVNIPRWGWVLIGLGIVIVGIALLSYLCCGKYSSGKVTKKKNKVAPHQGGRTLAAKHKMDAAMEEMGSRRSEFEVENMPYQHIPSLRDLIPTVS